MPKHTNRTIQVIPLPIYSFNREKRNHFTYIISNGVGRYACGITQKEIDEMYPVPNKIYIQENSNHKDDWKQDI